MKEMFEDWYKKVRCYPAETVSLAKWAWNHQQQRIDRLEQENSKLKACKCGEFDVEFNSPCANCYNKKLEQENKEFKNMWSELNYTHSELLIKQVNLKDQLKEAEKVIEFYGDWETSWEMDRIIPQDRELYFYANCDGVKMGGKKAREYLIKYKGE